MLHDFMQVQHNCREHKSVRCNVTVQQHNIFNLASQLVLLTIQQCSLT